MERRKCGTPGRETLLKAWGKECIWHISGNRVSIDLAGGRVSVENRWCEMVR